MLVSRVYSVFIQGLQHAMFVVLKAMLVSRVYSMFFQGGGLASSFVCTNAVADLFLTCPRSIVLLLLLGFHVIESDLHFVSEHWQALCIRTNCILSVLMM
jgi:hypothetical protein